MRLGKDIRAEAMTQDSPAPLSQEELAAVKARHDWIEIALAQTHMHCGIDSHVDRGRLLATIRDLEQALSNANKLIAEAADNADALTQRLSQAEAQARTPGTVETCSRCGSDPKWVLENECSGKYLSAGITDENCPLRPPHPQGSDEDISLRCAEPRLRGGE